MWLRLVDARVCSFVSKGPFVATQLERGLLPPSIRFSSRSSKVVSIIT